MRQTPIRLDLDPSVVSDSVLNDSFKALPPNKARTCGHPSRTRLDKENLGRAQIGSLKRMDALAQNELCDGNGIVLFDISDFFSCFSLVSWMPAWIPSRIAKFAAGQLQEQQVTC